MRKRIVTAGIAATLLAALAGAAPAAAADEFGFNEMDAFATKDGERTSEAGTHPDEAVTTFRVNTMPNPGPGVAIIPVEEVKHVHFELPPGFVGDPLAMPRCETVDFLRFEDARPGCSDDTALGITDVLANGFGGVTQFWSAIFNLEPPPGVAARLGFVAFDTPVTIEVGVKDAYPNNVVAGVRNVPQRGVFYGSEVKVWGSPADSANDPLRGFCVGDVTDPGAGPFPSYPTQGECPSNLPEEPFLTLPRSCEGPDITKVRASSWQSPDAAPFEATVTTPPGGTACSRLGFAPSITSQATTRSAESPSGLQFELELEDEGLTDPDGIANSDVKTAKVSLPEGVTINPSQAIGLQTCSPEQFAREKADSAPGAGCPQASKIGTTEVETPLLRDELLKGSVYVAEQDDPGTSTPGAENPFDSLIALYMTVKSERRGINVRLAGRVEPDPVTGQIVTSFGDGSSVDPEFDELPQLPFSDFRVRLREGGRSPLVTPPVCGTFQSTAQLTPWANPGKPLTVSAPMTITSGVGGAGCPSGSQPFEPGFEAGTTNNNGGSYSPFNMRLTRRDGDQDLVRFDATLPKGALAKIAGVGRCSDAQIAAIKTRTGKEELASPSCPEGSKIGSVQGGAGVGSQLVYVPGSVYLAGPFAGAPLSVVGVVPAVAGPFDVGVVVTRQALVIDPVTGVASVDGEKSDPIPHILEGIPLRVRDIQVGVDRPEFTINPTSCNPMATLAGIWGGGQNPFSLVDDSPVGRSARFQAAGCQGLGFKPRIGLRLFGKTRRGAYQGVRAVVRPRPGHANIAGSVVRFPRSAFVAQEHIRTVCTRVQFAADACPKGSIYGRAIARTPLLDFPLVGNVHLRSSDNELPDLVADLRGPAHTPIKVEVAIRNDSVKGALRNTVQSVPDAPVSYFRLQVFGGKKGLIVNSRNICKGRNLARTVFRGQNGKRAINRVPVRNARCKKQRQAKHSAHRRAQRRARSSVVR